MAGNGGTLARELLEQAPDARQIVVPVGGGGLLAGLLSVVERVAPHVQVVAVQSAACPSFVRSLAEGKVYARWEGSETVAEGLEGGTGPVGVALAHRTDTRAVAVPERTIIDVMRRVWKQEGVALEGSAAVVLAARQEGLLGSAADEALYVLTGANVDRHYLESLPD